MNYLYKITFPNKKLYIGQTNRPNKRWQEHKYVLKNPKMLVSRAIKKYGHDNCLYEIIVSCKTQDDANFIEEQLIKQYNTLDKNKGYNVRAGGDNAPKSEEWKTAMSERVSGENNPMYGKETWMKNHNHTSETKKIMSEKAKLHIGDKNNFYGKNHSNDAKLRMSIAKSKLSIEQMINILNDNRSQAKIAKDYQVSRTCIQRIKQGKNKLLQGI